MIYEIQGEPFKIRTKTYTVYFGVFKCHCGNNFPYNINHVRAGKCRGCGCSIKRGRPTHGRCNTPAWVSWTAMLTRCTNENASDYERYGGRGISIDPSWYQFENFYADMGDRPAGMTLDRINVNGNYCKENCKWSNYKEQARNKRNTVLFTYSGKTQHLDDWAEEYSINSVTLQLRMKKLGWSFERALTTQIDTSRRNKNAVCHYDKTQKEKEGRKKL